MPLLAGELRFDTATGTAGGEIVMDPARAATGVEMRDRTMRDEVFEVQRFPTIVYRPQRILGEVPSEGHGRVYIEGTLAIHGGEHPLTLPVALVVGPDAVRASTTFTVPYVLWGMHNPGNPMLRVADTVEVKIDTTVVLE